MPLKYVEPKKWKNKKKIKFPIWTEAAKKEVEALICEIPEGAEAKIMIKYVIYTKQERSIKKKKEHAVPSMGRVECDVFKGIISNNIALGDKSVKIQILWNEKENLLGKREEKILKEFNKTFKKAQ